jgi:hypothetical protein
MPVDLTLSPPERNWYFYGLLMDAERFEKETHYFNRKRHTLNRLGLGSGVLCGLNLSFDSTLGVLMVGPGIAIDGAGREIIVPSPTPVDPTQLTDAHGNPTGPAPAGSTILISLAYAEQKIDPVPVLVPDCDYPNGCAPSTIEESFAVIVALAGPVPAFPGCVLSGGFPLPPDATLQAAIATQVTTNCAPIPADPSIPLGRFTLPSGPLDRVSDRPPVYNNTLLYQLIVCLAARVSQISGDVLIYVSGDNQSAAAGAVLPNPLEVQLVDSSGNPVTSGAVTFTVASGGGSVSAVATSPDGKSQVTWTLGSSGAQTVTAQSTSSKFTVTFNATIQKASRSNRWRW